MTSVLKLPVALREREGLIAAAPRSFMDLSDPEVSREEVLARIDEDTLKSSPMNLLISTALAIASPDAAAYVEDAVLRYVTALTMEGVSDQAFLRLTAEKLVLADLEYQNALTAYTNAELEVPRRHEWANPQHYLEAAKIHERRMDRLLKVRKDSFDRYAKSAEVYRGALGRSAPAAAPAVFRSDAAEDAEIGTPVQAVRNVQIIVR